MTGDGPVGYYVHHHGRGHAAHAIALGAVLGDRLTGLGSGPPPAGWAHEWVSLPHDEDPLPSGDPTHGGAWHWLPTGHAGFSARMRRVSGWIQEAEPAVLVSDVSTEVLVLAALLGVPTVAVLLHGERVDRPHRLALDTADRIVAPWPASHREAWQEPWTRKIRHVGLLSRHDGRPRPGTGRDAGVVVLLPGGGCRFERRDLVAAATACGGGWQVVGAAPGMTASSGGPDHAVTFRGQVDDPYPLLAAADVVISAAGAASVADIAAAGRPAVLFPQPRPFDEQVALARHLDGEAPVVVAGEWPTPARWPRLLAEARSLDGARWDDLRDGAGAARFAAVVVDEAASG